MRRIRVLIADVPQMVYDLLKAEAESYDDVEIVGMRTTRSSLMQDVERTRADVVILEPLHVGSATECTALLYAFPRLSALAVSADEQRASLYELRLSETTLGDTSPAELVAAIRAQCLRRAAEVEADASR